MLGCKQPNRRRRVLIRLQAHAHTTCGTVTDTHTCTSETASTLNSSVASSSTGSHEPCQPSASDSTYSSDADNQYTPSMQGFNRAGDVCTSSTATVVTPTRFDPVTFSRCWTLQPQAGWLPAVAALRQAVAALLSDLEGMSSGVVRVEVPIPRGSSALRWLQGQPATELHQVYFSGRHSTAADTAGAARAEEGTKGWSAIAGETPVLFMCWHWNVYLYLIAGDACTAQLYIVLCVRMLHCTVSCAVCIV